MRDKLFRTMADLVVSEGYAAVGYEYINIDDCWLEKERNFRGELQPDKQRFPYGLRDLSNFLYRSANPHNICPTWLVQPLHTLTTRRESCSVLMASDADSNPD
uniref:Alpha-galactosidase n=1 Tax=Timema douglasi TaxID=61478 RepID=A0A7R8VK93_TIMDO|nr:unnamed protein product [Timema douglasi]